ncbi:aldo-keto reductase family 1 member B1 isoform X2 [Leptopilina boulardi]|uniref:aldo-keto reductase family 1 member B1 isoform X2 n=1 Tax=Leptopilina boulardi TaxID=63433 RepID=UPI0021F5C222|nr:aldo-keto reductase family 1 member B1 isoform X2 [Leptopilina boulardi]
MVSNLKINLPNGHEMPALGFGTWEIPEDDIELPFIGNDPNKVEKWLKNSLNDLQLNYLDLYLIHGPIGFEDINEEMFSFHDNGDVKLDMSTDHLAIWAELEKQVEAGRTRAIGLSNFNKLQIEKILDFATIPISNLQIELNVYFQQNELIEFCKENEITVTAYSPLGSRGLATLFGKIEIVPNLLLDPTIHEIATKHNKTPAQIALRFILEKNISVIPKSRNTERIYENIDIFDFELDSEDVIELNNLDMGSEARILDFASLFRGSEKHPEFPF